MNKLIRPQITYKSPKNNVAFVRLDDKTVITSEKCKLKIEIKIPSEVENLKCALRISIHKKYQDIFDFYDTDNPNTNQHEIYRYYGEQKEDFQDTFEFRITSKESIVSLKTYVNYVFLRIELFDCSYNDRKRTISTKWSII